MAVAPFPTAAGALIVGAALILGAVIFIARRTR
jgi:hypothetical protein